MYREHTIGVVVPAYNEEGLVGNVIDTMPDYVDRVYVIDDRSTDGTWDEIKAHAEEANARARNRGTVSVDGNLDVINGSNSKSDKQVLAKTDGGLIFDPRVVPIQHEHNMGVGGAIKTGYKRALEDGIDIAAVMAGDGQMDPDLLHKFLDPIVENKADYTKGNRLLYKEYRQGMSKWRFFGNAILTFLTKVSSGYWKMMDPQNGYTAISKKTIKNLDMESLYNRYGFVNDLLVQLNVNDVRIADIPTPAYYGDEESHIKYSSFIPKTSWLLLRNFLWRLRLKYLILDFNPLAVFYLLGPIALFVGTFGIGWSMYEKLVNSQPLFVPLTVSLIVFMIGSLFLTFAMLFDMQANADNEIRDYQ